MYRITNKRDLEIVEKVLSSEIQDLIEFIPGLGKQYAVVMGEAFGYSDIIKVIDANPIPNSYDPQFM